MFIYCLSLLIMWHEVRCMTLMFPYGLLRVYIDGWRVQENINTLDGNDLL